jgi:hypothetical protein
MKYLYMLLVGSAAIAQDVALSKPLQQEPLKPITLRELQINSGVKRHESEVKPLMHNKRYGIWMSNIGMKYAFLAVPEKENSYLSAISLPLIKIAFEAEGRQWIFERREYHSLVKIELLHNVDGKPGDTIEGFNQTAIVTNAESDKRFDIKLDGEVALPAEGVFVQLTIIGRCDGEGNLNHDRDFVLYKEKPEDTAERKWMEWCQPNFALVERPKGTLTFYKNQNYKDNAWRTIDEPALHQIKKYPDFNIGFGYTVVTYK